VTSSIVGVILAKIGMEYSIVYREEMMVDAGYGRCCKGGVTGGFFGGAQKRIFPFRMKRRQQLCSAPMRIIYKDFGFEIIFKVIGDTSLLGWAEARDTNRRYSKLDQLEPKAPHG
jgi:hypothetical protein